MIGGAPLRLMPMEHILQVQENGDGVTHLAMLTCFSMAQNIVAKTPPVITTMTRTMDSLVLATLATSHTKATMVSRNLRQ